MKRILLSVTLTFAAIALQGQNLYVQPTGGGEQVVFSIANNPRITFGTGTMNIEQMLFQLTNVQYLSFARTPPSTDVRPRADEQDPPFIAWINNDILHIAGLTIGKPYRIFTALGAMVFQGIVRSDVETLNVASLPRGVYIIHSEGQSLSISR